MERLHASAFVTVASSQRAPISRPKQTPIIIRSQWMLIQGPLPLPLGAAPGTGELPCCWTFNFNLKLDTGGRPP